MTNCEKYLAYTVREIVPVKPPELKLATHYLVKYYKIQNMWRLSHPESNLQPADYKSDALTITLLSYLYNFYHHHHHHHHHHNLI